MEKMMRYGLPIMIAGIALLLMNSLTKSFMLVAANIAEAEVEFILPVINWACLWFCIEQHIH
jgi:hypothetical protein